MTVSYFSHKTQGRKDFTCGELVIRSGQAFYAYFFDLDKAYHTIPVLWYLVTWAQLLERRANPGLN